MFCNKKSKEYCSRWYSPHRALIIVWDYMKRQMQLRQPKAMQELWQVLQDIWNILFLFLFSPKIFTFIKLTDKLIKLKHKNLLRHFNMNLSCLQNKPQMKVLREIAKYSLRASSGHV